MGRLKKARPEKMARVCLWLPATVQQRLQEIRAEHGIAQNHQVEKALRVWFAWVEKQNEI